MIITITIHPMKLILIADKDLVIIWIEKRLSRESF